MDSFQVGPMSLLPGAEPLPPTLAQDLATALAAKPAGYQPRTRHLADGGRPLFTNRLLLETSPYLQQHAHNPVNWHPWGEEAFATARRLGRPILLSIGYSTCHWCHVMEEESFEDEEIAAYLNAHYVPVKVDREERPDVDAVYMACVQAWTGHGGWPMTVWLAPDKHPYFGGTYFAARDGDRGARAGFLTLLIELRRVYDEQPERVAEAARRIVDAIGERMAGERAGELPGAETLHRAYTYYERSFDGEWGGLAQPPKFPSSLPVRFLLRYFRRFGGEALAMAELTLEKMAAGGLRDHVGGGFHRYSVDGEWLVPHFEKMLYDNALLALSYLEAWQVTGRVDFAAVAEETLNYVLAEMTAPHGGFYSATDADSPNPTKHGEREEGWFFTWTPDELAAVLGSELTRIATTYFAVTPHGNFEGRSILHTPRPATEVARELALPEAELQAHVKEIKRRLYEARLSRPAPLRDDKILAGWNGLMISALARGAQILHQPRFLAAAKRAARFLLSELVQEGRLLRSYKDGPGKVPGFLEDHAFLLQGLLDLYETSFDLDFLRAALRLASDAEARFLDPAEGGYFATPSDGEALLVREKPGYDGAVPSGNSVMALCLLRLAALTGDDAYRMRAEGTLRAFHQTLSRAPAAMAEMLLAADFRLDRTRQILLVMPHDLSEAAPFLDRLGRTFLPSRVVAAVTAAELPNAAGLVPLFQEKLAAGGKPTAYVCDDTVCRLPVQDVAAFADQLL